MVTQTSPTQESVTLTIDDRQVTVPKGTNVLQAAEAAGITIPYFCWHPGLSIAACCRQCLVSIKGQPKLAPSCQTPAAQGMVVGVAEPRAALARQQQLEFTLVNHPIDCPICDKAGECLLQRYYFDWDAKPSRVVIDKVAKSKRVDLGPTIVLDQERCILCTRCIRVCDEVAGQHQLEMVHRGDRELLTTAPGQLLDNPYSLNTVDVCPVGALTAKDFRFTMRAWELTATQSICNGCATGCNIEVHHKEGRVFRLVPRPNADVNKHWMCDEGRFTYKSLAEERLASPLVDGLPASWERALSTAALRLSAVLDVDRGAVGVVLSAGHTNEDNYLLLRLAREFLGLSRIYALGKPPVSERADKILRVADVNPNWAGVRALCADAGDAKALEKDLISGAVKALIVLGSDAPLSEAALGRVGELGALVSIAAHERGLVPRAQVALAAADWAEVHGTIVNKDGRVQRMRSAVTPPGQALPAWEAITRLARKLGATFEYTSARVVFKEMTAAVPALAAEWGRELLPVQLRFAGSRG